MIAGDMHVGGIENQLMHLARNIDKKKYQIDFTSTMPQAFYREEIEQLGGKFILIPPMEWKRPKKYCDALFQIMKEGKYDIVHSHELFHSGITLWIAKRAGVPCRFVHAHNWCDDDGFGRKISIIRRTYNFVMQRLINKYSTIQIACSTWAGKFLYGEKMQKKDSYHLVFNSVDTGKFLDKYDQKENGEFCDDGWINILNVARITPVKNQLFLVDIAEEFRNRGVKMRILCAGNGIEEYESQVRRMIDQKQLGDYIRLLGVRKDIDVLSRKCSAFVLPSKYEGMPLVIIEAQATGLPCVSADTYSPEVDFGVGLITWISLNKGAKEWASALEHAVKKTKPDKKCIENAVSEKRYDSKMFAETLSILYEEDYLLRKGKR